MTYLSDMKVDSAMEELHKEIDNESGEVCSHLQTLKEIHERLEKCIAMFESANDHKQTISIQSYQMVMYEISNKINKTITSNK